VNGQNFVTRVKDQGDCNSCVAFATVAAAEGTFKRNQNDSKRKVDYSEAQLFLCWARSQGQNCKGGWWPSNALKAMRRNGVVEDSCFKYDDVDLPCNLCTDASYHLSRIVGWHKIESINEMKKIG
jgi:C1A family cysteine protease